MLLPYTNVDAMKQRSILGNESNQVEIIQEEVIWGGGGGGGEDQFANQHYRRYEEYIVAECVGNVNDNWRKILAKLCYLWKL